ncbi:MAG: class I SAM-dependent RNA methyltransferase [Burkholderiales bacterium]|nr:class I SAM-dependent RNA methyltransferase [Burkholderiales bacterium]MDE2432499.1 class I SAM-dependent RNA methyltransferase [Burkholderiales bacterium]
MPIKPTRRPVVSAATGRPSQANPRAISEEGPAVLRPDQPSALYLPCPVGVEELLCAEVARILGPEAHVQQARGGVEVQGRLPGDLIESAMRLNLESRLAQRVLWRVASRVYRHEDDIYALGRTIRWTDWITPRHTLRVDVTSRNSPLRSLNFAGLRIKDAVCDDLRERTGERPNVDTRHPDLGLVLHLDDFTASLYVDTSGEALFKRGWREDKGEAPLKETLAAAMLAAAGWQGRPEDGPLLDPCCGAGTIPIEAAQIACGIAPGLLRRFAFERLLPFRDHLPAWQAMRQAAKARQHPPQVPIYAGDVAFRMTDFATRNAQRAGVLHAIEFKTADALQRPAPSEHGVMMFNPPYGERIDPKGSVRSRGHRHPDGADEMAAPRSGREQFQDAEANDFFLRLAAHWKRQYTGWTAWVLSPDMKLPGAMHLKESRRVVLFNGPIECRLFRFDLTAGKHAKDRSSDD